ncbi:MAG TPA: radical SAM protein [Thermoanaerobaculia bacterium]|nr:radical SAM protein [Thermoanaerobaculia bacterium]
MSASGDVLLSHGYFLAEDEKERQIMKPYPPLGLLYLSGFLKSRGFAPRVFDTTFRTRDDLYAALATWTGAKVLGLYTNLMTRRAVVEIAAKARELGFTVVLGGPESANYPEEYLARGADVVVLGEGEETLAELLPALAARGPHALHGVAGTVFRDADGTAVHNLPRLQIADLDAIPDPDREAIDVDAYVDVWRTHHGAGSVNLITARGCPYKCDWCSHAVFGFTHRRRSPARVADEVARIRDRYRPDQLWYADDVFTLQHGWLFAYAKELRARGLWIPFETISRADRMMKEEVLETLAGMGCSRIWIGSESGSQRILDAMQRGVTVEQVRWATKAAQRHGIAVGMFLMWGYDGETVEDIEATIEHVKQSGPDVFFTTVAYPIKNTGYFDKVAGRVVLGKTWDDATDRDHRIAGRHGRTYYRHADRWLRSEVEAHRLDPSDPGAAAAKRIEARAAREALLAAADEVEA